MSKRQRLLEIIKSVQDCGAVKDQEMLYHSCTNEELVTALLLKGVTIPVYDPEEEPKTQCDSCAYPIEECCNCDLCVHEYNPEEEDCEECTRPNGECRYKRKENVE